MVAPSGVCMEPGEKDGWKTYCPEPTSCDTCYKCGAHCSGHEKKKPEPLGGEMPVELL